MKLGTGRPNLILMAVYLLFLFIRLKMAMVMLMTSDNQDEIRSINSVMLNNEWNCKPLYCFVFVPKRLCFHLLLKSNSLLMFMASKALSGLPLCICLFIPILSLLPKPHSTANPQITILSNSQVSTLFSLYFKKGTRLKNLANSKFS